MTTNVSVASQAMLLLRANTFDSFSDDTNEAEICNVTYEEHMKHLLSIYPWTFATKKRQLNQDTTTPINEYNYAHIIPAEALLLWALFNTSSVGAAPIRDYDIYGTDSSRRIFSNHPSLWGDYTIYPSETVWPSYFTMFAINSYAAYSAMAITGDPELANYYDQIAYGTANSNRKGGLFGVAMSTDAKQKRNEVVFSSPLTEARFS